MTLVPRKPAALLLTAVFTAVLLPVMAALQYRWIGEVSQAAKERMSNDVKRNTSALARDFDDQFRQLGFRQAVNRNKNTDRQTPEELVKTWAGGVPNLSLVSRVYLVEQPDAAKTVFRVKQLDLKSSTLHSVEMPEELRPMVLRLQNGKSATDPDLAAHAMPLPRLGASRDPPRRRLPPERREPRQFGGPPEDMEGPRGPGRRHPGEEGPPPEFRNGRRPPRPEDGDTPDFGPPPRREPNRAEPEQPRPDAARQQLPGVRPNHYQAWMILFCDQSYVAKTLLPELMLRHFGSTSDFLIHLKRNLPSAVPLFSTGDFQTADASVAVLQMPEGDPEGQPVTDNSGLWRIEVRHKAGSLESIVAETQRRDLGVSAVIFCVLAMSIAGMFVVSRRMAHLAQMQMEFVAGVSHELRTPLAVVNAAADNLSAGIVQPESVKKYGALIRKETRRLGKMVEDVLAFSGVEHSRRPRNLQQIEIASMVEAALAGCAAELSESGFTVEKTVAPDLPPLQGDPAWLEQCLRNLIGNAVKYAKAGRWLSIRASREDGMAVLRVEDHGPGIEPGDARKIFTPFYRSRSAAQAQIEGSGIGLSVVKRIVEAHGGTVSVESEPGNGSRFTVRLPFAPAGEAQA